MPVYPNSKMDSYSAHGGPERSECDVNIENGAISISYREGTGVVVYKGEEIQPGHFKLKAESTNRIVNSTATLHQFHGEDVLEGSWLEEGYIGMWRIVLSH
jgi:hypothetical protein